MNKLITAAFVALVSTVGFSTPAAAQYCSTGSAQQAPSCTTVSSNRLREYDNARARGNGYNYQPSYQPVVPYNNYNYDPQVIYSQPNRVKIKTARRGGKWYQDCGETIGVVELSPGQTCLTAGQSAPRIRPSSYQPQGSTLPMSSTGEARTSTWIERRWDPSQNALANVLVTETVQPDGQRFVTSEPADRAKRAAVTATPAAPQYRTQLASRSAPAPASTDGFSAVTFEYEGK